MGRLPARTTVLCGAGVSQGSGLPDGQTLARLALDLVWEGARVYLSAAALAVHDALRWPVDGEPELRLELILDLMTKHIPSADHGGRVFGRSWRGAVSGALFASSSGRSDRDHQSG